jgi:hypothetical protein
LPIVSGSAADVVRRLERDGDGAAGWIVEAVDSGIEVLLARDDADRLAPWEVIQPFAEQVLGDVLRRLTEDREAPEPGELRARPELVADIVARDVELQTVLGTLRLLQHHWIGLLTEEAVGAGEARALPDVVHVLVATVDGWAQASLETVLDERRRLLDSSSVQARGVVEAVVAGEPVDVESASRLLGVPLDGWHQAVAVGARPGSVVAQPAVRAVATSLERAVRGGATLRYETTTGQAWLWVSGPRRGRVAAPGDLAVEAPLVVGIGGSHQGVEGMRRSHLEAVDALRLAVRSDDTEALAYDDVALAALLSQDEERARWFVDHELGEVAGAEHGDLRDTLRAFFSTKMRIAPAAEQLFVHRNTLINRLERIERLLDHRVSERTAEVQAALLLHENGLI